MHTNAKLKIVKKTLRRTFATRASEVGIDYLTIKRMLNHKSNDITGQYIQWNSRQNLLVMRNALEIVRYWATPAVFNGMQEVCCLSIMGRYHMVAIQKLHLSGINSLYINKLLKVTLQNGALKVTFTLESGVVKIVQECGYTLTGIKQSFSTESSFLRFLKIITWHFRASKVVI